MSGQEKTTILNLDLSCLKESSQLEESLAVAASAVNQVKSLKACVVTIQCCITEESLEELVFRKLENQFARKFTCSPDPSYCPNTCVAWKKDVYSCVCVNLDAMAKLFPQSLAANTTMVHLFTDNSTQGSLSVISWGGLSLTESNKLRTTVFETALRREKRFKGDISVHKGLFEVELSTIQDKSVSPELNIYASQDQVKKLKDILIERSNGDVFKLGSAQPIPRAPSGSSDGDKLSVGRRTRRTPRGLSPYKLDFSNLSLDSPDESGDSKNKILEEEEGDAEQK